MERRPLHAVLLSGAADAARLIDPLAAALDGAGPAILPLDAGLPAARLGTLLGAFRPDVVVGVAGDATARSGGQGTAPDTAVVVGSLVYRSRRQFERHEVRPRYFSTIFLYTSPCLRA